MQKNKIDKSAKKANKTIFRGLRIDLETDKMFVDFAHQEGRSLSNALAHLARIGLNDWKMSRKNISNVSTL